MRGASAHRSRVDGTRTTTGTASGWTPITEAEAERMLAELSRVPRSDTPPEADGDAGLAMDPGRGNPREVRKSSGTGSLVRLAGFAALLALAGLAARWIVQGTNPIPAPSASTGASLAGPGSGTGAEVAPDGAKSEQSRGSTINRSMAAMLAGAMVTAGASAQSAAVQWRVEDGGNGHWYACHRFDAPTDWPIAKAMAETMGGHLATIRSLEENAFVFGVALDEYGSVTHLASYLGARKNASGAFEWVTGEPFDFTNWKPGEPNGGWWEPYLHFINAPLWNDTTGTHRSAIIEWSADCNNDGIIDYGQISTGQLADLNGDGIPDVCQQPTCIDADFFPDRNVNGADLGILISQWGEVTQYTVSDLNGDGVVDGQDLGIFISFWGPCTP